MVTLESRRDHISPWLCFEEGIGAAPRVSLWNEIVILTMLTCSAIVE
jgi:hypothetical protein